MQGYKVCRLRENEDVKKGDPKEVALFKEYGGGLSVYRGAACDPVG